MKLKTRILVIILATLLGLLALSGIALYSLRQTMLRERESQIRATLELAINMAAQYQQQEQLGKLTREDAQNKAKEALSGLRRGDDYIFVRTTDNIRIVHPDKESLGKLDLGMALPDGRTSVQAFADILSISKIGFVKTLIAKPGQSKPQPKLTGVAMFKPWGWVFGIGFYLDDIEATFWKQAGVLVVVNLILLIVVTFLVVKMTRQILGQLGGEPQYAAECMRKISSGDLGIDIDTKNSAENSLIASLKVMQMKLKNISVAIHDNADTLETQVRNFDEHVKSYLNSRSDADFDNLQRCLRKVLGLANVFNKSINRIKV